MISTITEFWGWKLGEAEKVVLTNLFGNYIIRNTLGEYWRICPEELKCELIAKNDKEFDTKRKNQDFIIDWEMANIVKIAKDKLGDLPKDRCYYLVEPAVLGGTYEADNIESTNRESLIGYAGEIAEQIDPLPDGTPIKINFVD